MKRVHIIGAPRSGTTLMLELMSNGFRFTAISKREVSLLEYPHGFPEDSTVCTKNPQDHRLVSTLIDRDEQQWFISMVRDPRDIVCSRHGFHPEVYWANLRQWRAWLDNTRPYRTHPRMIEIRYEDLVRSPDEVQQEIAARLPFLPVRNAFSEFHKFAKPSDQSLNAMGDVRPVSDASVGRWKSNLARLAGQLQVHGSVSAELIEFGYETDEKWLGLLEGIEPDTSPGHWPEFIPQEWEDQYQERQKAMLAKYLQARKLP